jgi:hypothetical protein
MFRIGNSGAISARSLDSAYASLGMMVISTLFNSLLKVSAPREKALVLNPCKHIPFGIILNFLRGSGLSFAGFDFTRSTAG